MKCAYVTLATSEEYLNTASYLQTSLRIVKSEYPLIVMISEELKDHPLLNHFDQYEIIPYYNFNKNNKLSELHYNHTFNKFYAYNFIQYEKLCFLDADAFLLINIDKYFELTKEIEFVITTYHPIRLPQENCYPKGNVFIFTPNTNTFNFILDRLKDNNNSIIEDESVIKYILYPEHFKNAIWDNKCNLFENFPFNYDQNFPIFIHPTKEWYKFRISYQSFEGKNLQELYSYILNLLEPKDLEAMHAFYKSQGSLIHHKSSKKPMVLRKIQNPIPIELGFMRHDISNPQKGQELIDWAMSHGVNHFEHCSFYLNWQCEDYMYSLLKKYPRESYYICGKLPVYNVITHRDFKELFQEQLNKVPGHYFDTYILQAMDDRSSLDIYEQNIIPYFLEQKKLGNIKRFGISIQCIPETFEKYLKLKCFEVVQMPINYYDWFLCRYDENYVLARKYNIPIIAQAPVKGGLLIKNSNIPENSFQEYFRNNIEADYDFISRLEGIEAILCGNSNLQSFEKTYNAIMNPQNIPLNKYQSVLNVFIKEVAPISCIGCGRCDNVCPIKIPVMALVRLYNLGLRNKTYFNAYSILRDSIRDPYKMCKKCYKCTEICPYQHDFPILFKDKIFELRT